MTAGPQEDVSTNPRRAELGDRAAIMAHLGFPSVELPTIDRVREKGHPFSRLPDKVITLLRTQPKAVIKRMSRDLNLRKLEPELKVALALHIAQSKPSVVAEHIARLHLPEARDRFEIAVACLVSGLGTGLIKNLNGFGLPEELRFEIAKLCALRNPGQTANEFRHFQLTRESDRREVLRLCLGMHPETVVKHIRNFAILDPRVVAEVGYAWERYQHRVAQPESSPSLQLENVARNIAQFEVESDEFRKMAAQRLSKVAPAEVVRGISGFGLPDPVAVEIVIECLRGSERPIIDELGEIILEHPESFEPILLAALDKDAAAFLEKFPRLDRFYPEPPTNAVHPWSSVDERADSLFRVLCHAASKAPAAVLKHESTLAPLTEDQRLTLFGAIAEGNFWLATYSIERFCFGPSARQQAVTGLVQRNVGQAIQHRIVGTDLGCRSPEERRELLRGALCLGKFDNAQQIARLCCAPAGEYCSKEQLGEAFDECLREVHPTPKSDESGSGHSAKEQENLEVGRLIRKTRALPSDALLGSIRLFDGEGRDFCRVLLLTYGDTFGAAIIKGLAEIAPRGQLPVAIEKKGYAIPHEIRGALGALLQTGFRGVSGTVLQEYLSLHSRSPHQALAWIKELQRGATLLLVGEDAAPEVMKQPYFAECVAAAYRPVGMPLAEVRRLLNSGVAVSYQRHLDPFIFPREGYELVIGSRSELTLTPNSKLDEARLSATSQILIEALKSAEGGEAETRKPFSMAKQVVLSLHGDFARVRKGELMRELVRGSADPRPAALGHKVAAILNRVRGVGEQHELAALLTELFGVVTNDMVEIVGPRVAPEIEHNSKVEGAMRRLLGMDSDRAVGVRQRNLATKAALLRIFDEERAMLKREMKKFATKSGGDRRELKVFLSKAAHAFFGRAGAGLCTARDSWSWANPNYLQMAIVDPGVARIVGNIQLHLFHSSQMGPAVLARVNPVQELVQATDPRVLVRGIAEVVDTFARANGRTAYFPEQDGHISLTNRHELVPVLKRYFGKQETVSVRVSHYHTVLTAYPLAGLDQGAEKLPAAVGTASA